MAKLPYFPLDAKEYLLDTKIRGLNKTERGVLVDLWCFMWINQVRRGHLLERVNGKVRALTDDEIAEMLQLSEQDWTVYRKKLTEKVGILRIGKFKELYSKRQSKYKTKHEIYELPSETYRKPIGKKSDGNIIRSRRGIELELEVEEEYFGDLIQTFPGIDHEQELLNADAWHKSQPKEKKKKNHHAFLRNWFQKTFKEKESKNAPRELKYPS